MQARTRTGKYCACGPRNNHFFSQFCRAIVCATALFYKLFVVSGVRQNDANTQARDLRGQLADIDESKTV